MRNEIAIQRRYVLIDHSGSPLGRGRCDVCDLYCHGNRWHLWLSVWDNESRCWRFTGKGELWAHITCIEQRRDPNTPVITYDEYTRERRNRMTLINQ